VADRNEVTLFFYNMKKLIITLAAIVSSLVGSAQQKTQVEWPDYNFTVDVQNPVTSIKDQYRSGTCWCFSTLAFVESEIIRINEIKNPDDYPDLSEMFVVSHSYMDRAIKYVRLDGNLRFDQGSVADDVLDIIREYGFVPQEAMPGMNYGTELPVQGELNTILKGYVDAVVSNPNKTLTTAWSRGFQAVLDEYLGKYPESFNVAEMTFTPKSYREHLKFNPDDYVTLTSYTHHPFYTKFALEICDNWRWSSAYNLPLDEFMEVVDAAIKAGYTIAWGADVSDPGFNRKGLAALVDMKNVQTAGSDRDHWLGREETTKASGSAKNKKILPPAERVVSQESRQKEFDNKTVTDDHGMQIFGIAHDQWGNKYYMVKNSWGTDNLYNGIWYVTEAYLKNQTIDYMLHKDAIPQSIKDKLGID